MPNREDILKDLLRERVEELDVIIAWERGFDPACATPIFIRKAEDVDKVVADSTCAPNLSVYLPALKDKKVGIVVKGCDSKSVAQLLAEGLLDRENLTIIGLPCSGTLDREKIITSAGNAIVESVCIDDEKVTITTDEGENTLALEDVLLDRCLGCKQPNPVLADVVAGDETPVREGAAYAALEEFLGKTDAERFEFWNKEMERCIRCYACRNACPLCVCRSHCAGESRDPKWVGRENNPRNNMSFQLMHAMHMAGRCTNCGECQRACPMGIPVGLFKAQLNSIAEELFDFRAGTDDKATAPLLTFKMEEENIPEHPGPEGVK